MADSGDGTSGGRKSDPERSRGGERVLRALPGGGQPRVPPHDEAAERAVLAAMLLDPVEVVPTVEAILTPDDFYSPAHGVLFETMLEVAARGHLDVLTLAAALRAKERLNTIGGAQYLGELTDWIPTIVHVESHAGIVAELAQARRMIASAERIVVKGYLGESPAADFVQDSAGEITRVAESRRSAGAMVPLASSLHESFQRIETVLTRRETHGSAIAGITWGLRDLDRLTQGMHGAQLIIVAARPGAGKTSFALKSARAAAQATGKLVLFFSLEMARVELTDRLLAGEARVDAARLKSAMLSQDDMTALTRAANDLQHVQIHIDDTGERTVAEMRATARRMKAQHGLAAVFIDYLQIVKVAKSTGGPSNREQEIGQVSRGLKLLAKELDVPVIALAQLNRSCETRPGKDKRPRLSDLRESGSIEQDADVVMFLYRDELYNKDTEDRGIAELIVAKQRNGGTDTVRARFIRELTLFEDLAVDDPRYGLGGGDGVGAPLEGDDDLPPWNGDE